MKQSLQSWRHVFKLDPDRLIGDEALEAVCMSGSDAIMVGGSSGLTYDNTVELLSRIRQFEIPCVLEVSDLEAVTPGFDLYMIPMVLNTTRSDWLIGHQARAVEQYGYMIPWDMLVPEGYIVLNPDSTVARITEADSRLDASAVAAYAQVADKLLRMPIVYVEYSGMFGDMELVSDVRRSLYDARLFYGGGITDAESARRAAAVCDTIVVGNVVYSDLQAALDTVRALKGEQQEQQLR
ncbi:putative glycerol-1-phosphate prenyltransferase [Fontibacillus phaseoli]|uniref:Heptaprenylglyceryl phosphate synthase n=1 Tax=Fontibacillus phaseoli TaxID=1416533 RepID=A0A369BEJ5_9BACL|nr:heptaprenylglyceryl phosphate synthase [Fontibacillus phaseoli]RCX18996.1 putative glycerol-1-phosphate prenyltransferase [Fontibacillus phaseoli]